tara:strand:- start:532 stop:945 length:414 start_codon:yes stop_codon:yes gene_type:complete
VRTYQTVVINKPDLDEAQVEEVSQKITGFIAKYSGSVVKLEIWGKKRLAYRIRKNRYGFYLNICHTLLPSNVSEFEKEMRLDEGILKYLVILLEPDEIERLCSENKTLDEDGKEVVQQESSKYDEEDKTEDVAEESS